jgi:SAM-dependent methyltransferase
MAKPLTFDEETSRRVEALYRTPDAIRRRSFALQLLEPREGERILDVGCGPGFLAADLAAAVGPGGLVHALDVSPSMLALAAARCAPLPCVKLERADAGTLALAADAYDAALSVQVHEYVAEVEGSLRSLARALRPDGRALVVATDWDSLVWASSDRGRMARVLSAFEEHLAHPHLPRALVPLLARVGLPVQRVEVLVQLNAVLDASGYSHGLLDLVHRFVPGRRGVTQAEADAWADDLRALGARGEYFFSLNQYFFLARRS